MYPDRGIFHADRWSDGISTIPDDLNTLTSQYFGTNNAPPPIPVSLSLLHVILPKHGLYLRYVYVYVYVYRPVITTNVMITASTLPTCQDTPGILSYCYHWHLQLHAGCCFRIYLTHCFLLDSTHRFQLGSTYSFRYDSTYGFRFDLTRYFSIIFDSHLIL